MVNHIAILGPLVTSLQEERDESQRLRAIINNNSKFFKNQDAQIKPPSHEVIDTNLENNIISMLFDVPILRLHSQLLKDINRQLEIFEDEHQPMRWLRQEITQSLIRYEFTIDTLIRSIKNSKDPHNIEQHFVGANQTYDPRWILTKSSKSHYMNSDHYSQIVRLGTQLLNSTRSQNLIDSILPNTRLAIKPRTASDFSHENTELLTSSMKEHVVQVIESATSILALAHSNESSQPHSIQCDEIEQTPIPQPNLAIANLRHIGQFPTN